MQEKVQAVTCLQKHMYTHALYTQKHTHTISHIHTCQQLCVLAGWLSQWQWLKHTSLSWKPEIWLYPPAPQLIFTLGSQKACPLPLPDPNLCSFYSLPPSPLYSYPIHPIQCLAPGSYKGSWWSRNSPGPQILWDGYPTKTASLSDQDPNVHSSIHVTVNRQCSQHTREGPCGASISSSEGGDGLWKLLHMEIVPFSALWISGKGCSLCLLISCIFHLLYISFLISLFLCLYKITEPPRHVCERWGVCDCQSHFKDPRAGWSS